MRVADFDFSLPRSAIADRPVAPRHAARMLDVLESGLVDRTMLDLPASLRAGDVMVFNDTRVIPARLFGRRGEAGVEVMLHQPLGPSTWAALVRGAKKLRPGQCVVFAEGFSAIVREKTESGEVVFEFDRGDAALFEALDRYGHIPLPPYIGRPDDLRDRSDYQTVYAAHEGAVAAPTAGLHFTPDLLSLIDAVGVRRVHVTLHVGAGTFLPVKVEDTEDHKMHAEIGIISAEAAAEINAARAAGGRVICVGTTSLRLLESAAKEDGSLTAYAQSTDIFMTPGYRFRGADMLVTNFHLPKSTLFMLVCAFAGFLRMREAYAHAIASGYRFYSYGDGSLLRHDPYQAL